MKQSNKPFTVYLETEILQMLAFDKSFLPVKLRQQICVTMSFVVI